MFATFDGARRGIEMIIIIEMINALLEDIQEMQKNSLTIRCGSLVRIIHRDDPSVKTARVKKWPTFSIMDVVEAVECECGDLMLAVRGPVRGNVKLVAVHMRDVVVAP